MFNAHLVANLYFVAEWIIRISMFFWVPNRRSPEAAKGWLLLIFFLPIPGLLVGQLFGALTLSVPVIAVIALGLLVINAGLMWLAIALFDRETILTRWK